METSKEVFYNSIAVKTVVKDLSPKTCKWVSQLQRLQF